MRIVISVTRDIFGKRPAEVMEMDLDVVRQASRCRLDRARSAEDP